MLLKPRLQVALLSVEKKLFLQKPKKHQPINEYSGVPALILRDVFADLGNAVDEIGKGFALLIEFGVELFGDFIAIKSRAQALSNGSHAQRFFFAQREADR